MEAIKETLIEEGEEQYEVDSIKMTSTLTKWQWSEGEITLVPLMSTRVLK